MKRITMMVLAVTVVLAIGSTAIAAQKIEGRNVEYTAGGVALKGYLAFDKSIKGQRPGILVVHEWWGQNEYVRKRARMLAQKGYTALALDMYGEGRIADHPDDAGKFASEVMKNFPVARDRFLAALDFLRSSRLSTLTGSRLSVTASAAGLSSTWRVRVWTSRESPASTAAWP